MYCHTKGERMASAIYVPSVVGVLCRDDDTFPLDCAALTLEHLSPLKADKLRLESLQSRASLS